MFSLKIRRVSWVILIPALFLAVLACFMIYHQDSRALKALADEELRLKMVVSQNQQEEQSLRQQIENVSTSAQMEALARQQDFMKEGELRFEVVDPDLLDMYTEEEWEIMMMERKLCQF